MKRKIVPILYASLLLGFLFDFLFFDKQPGISVLIYSLFILGSTVCLAALFKSRLSISVYALMPAVVFFALMVAVRASGMLAFCNVVLSIYLLLLIARLSYGSVPQLSKFSIVNYFSPLLSLPFRFMREANSEFPDLLAYKTTPTEKKSYTPIVRGILIAIPILAVFLALLSSADLVFQKYVTSIFNLHLHINASLVWQIVLLCIVAFLFMGAFVLLFMRPRDKANDKPRITNFELGTIETSIVLGSVGVLFLIFLLVQITYFFGGDHHVMTTNFTYAEYARHGFFELIAVAAITLLLIWAVKQWAKAHNDREKQTFTWLSCALLAEVMVIMLSAHMRLNLYEQTYGYTRLRLASHLFIAWLAVAMILMAIHIIRSEKEERFAFRLFLSVLAFFVVLNLINPDAVIARHNISRLASTGKLDPVSLTYLSEDATPLISALLPSSSPTTQDVISRHLHQQQQSLECGPRHWQSFNFARHAAQKNLDHKQIEPLFCKQ